MRKILTILILLALLVAMLVFGRRVLFPDPAPLAVVPALPQLSAAAEPTPVVATTDQLIVQAVGADSSQAHRAQEALEKIGHCPELPDSPEGPVGLAAASYGLHDNDADRVRATIQLLTRLGCDIDQYSAVGLTPLHGAVIGRQPELLKFLMEQGADPKLRVIHIPGKELGRTIANLDAYGLAKSLLKKFPEDESFKVILELLKSAS